MALQYQPAHRPSPASLIAGMLDTLATCVTEPQMRAWVSATAEFRAILPEMLLQRIEGARVQQEEGVSVKERQRVVAERVRAIRRPYVRTDNGKLITCDGKIYPSLLSAIRRVQRLRAMSDSTFGLAAMRDPNLIRNLKDGRTLRLSTELRLRAFIRSLETEAA